MLVQKAYQFRIYPSQEQATLIRKTIGCSRYVYNYFLARCNDTYQTSRQRLNYETCSRELTKLKREMDWLREPDKFSLQNALRDLSDAFNRFFRKQNRAPQYKSKKHPKQSYQTNVTNGNIAVIGNRIKLPKLGLVKFAKSREVEGRIINVTVRLNASGKYFVSVLTETQVSELPKTGRDVGIDMGLKHFAVLSDGSLPVENPRVFRKLEAKLAVAQRRLSRRKPGGSNYQKAKVKVARIHERIANARRDYLNKLSTHIVKNHDMIAIEDLGVADMLQDRQWSKSISEVSWSKFRSMLTYKAKWYGRQLVVIDRSFPSSQLCSCCGYKNENMKNLDVRSWHCPKCGADHDRDRNASLNILAEGRRLLCLNETTQLSVRQG